MGSPTTFTTLTAALRHRAPRSSLPCCASWDSIPHTPPAAAIPPAHGAALPSTAYRAVVGYFLRNGWFGCCPPHRRGTCPLGRVFLRLHFCPLLRILFAAATPTGNVQAPPVCRTFCGSHCPIASCRSCLPGWHYRRLPHSSTGSAVIATARGLPSHHTTSAATFYLCFLAKQAGGTPAFPRISRTACLDNVRERHIGTFSFTAALAARYATGATALAGLYAY